MKTLIFAFSLCCLVAQVFASSQKLYDDFCLPCRAPERDPRTRLLVFCGRGPNRRSCSPGYTCNIHPADRYAVCCPKQVLLRKKPGRCPPLHPGTAGICAELCSGDYSCPGNSKCCSNGCGHVCKAPILPIKKKPGRCPPLLPGTVGICVELCSNDYSCPGNSKCCSNGCGHVCKAPLLPIKRKPGRCPPLLPGTAGICVELCSSDFSCRGNMKCCSNGCGHVCKLPVAGYL